MYFLKNRQSGFTLLELLVVIAIIGILAAVVLASLNSARVKGRNSDVLSQMYEYQKALDLYYLNAPVARYPSGFSNGNPNPAFRGRTYCIGDEYTGGQCMPFSENSDTTSEIETALVPDYVGRIRHIDQGTFSSPAYRGCSDICTAAGCTNSQCSDQDYSLLFVLEGQDQDCGRAIQVSDNISGSGYTWCQLRKTE